MIKYKKSLNGLVISKQATNMPCAKISNSKDSYEYVKQFYGGDIDIYESMFLLLLNRANNTEGFVKISQGGIAGTVVDIKLIMFYAIQTLSSNIILVHNHPSGNTTPSKDDKDITEKIKQGGKLLDITLLDHLIISKDSYYSFADDGELNKTNK